MLNSIRIEYLLDIFLARSKLTSFGFVYLHFVTLRLIDFAEDVSDERTELERAGFLFNDLQQKTTK